MRTTLTLDSDVVKRLAKLRATRRLTLKAAVNEALRTGLDHLEAPKRKRKAHRVEALHLGACRLASLDDISEVLAVAEGEDFR